MNYRSAHNQPPYNTYEKVIIIRRMITAYAEEKRDRCILKLGVLQEAIDLSFCISLWL